MLKSPPFSSERSVFAELLAIARYHIMLVAMAATVVFGWIATGTRPWALTLVVTVDWFLINLMNRVTDIDEDLRNGIPGTERVARRRRGLTVASIALMIASFIVTHTMWPTLTPLRLVVQAIGVAYNYRIVPTPKGLSRFKEMYFFKNFGSSVLFVLTCFVYPIAAAGWTLVVPWPAVVVLALFFVPFELTYEILYDMRDLEGDRAEGIPTYPVVHGVENGRRIIDALLAASAAVLAAAFFMRLIGVRELLMIVAPIAQWVFYRPRYRRGLTSRDCIVLTHLGTAQLVLFIAGTELWRRAGLPVNLFL